ncbi:hypothetical protein WR25_13874 [Diploscapter pachys]|uniref:Uncharacterized protein n=1 Tax=Diploscapter pachys TaxID=2018661 RepID=A0A2A2KY32_9BILA|nr:hypothetical protein WR25_13874 [Diploscapter pachys]
MSDHRDNVIEKDYGHFGRESPTDETARRIVNDAVQAAREGMGDISPHGIRSVDDYFPDPHQAAQQAHDDLLDIRDDLVPHHNDFLPEPPKADVHDEVDDMLNRMRANDEAQEQYRPKDYDLDMDQPDFRSQTPEPEETTFNR